MQKLNFFIQILICGTERELETMSQLTKLFLQPHLPCKWHGRWLVYSPFTAGSTNDVSMLKGLFDPFTIRQNLSRNPSSWWPQYAPSIALSHGSQNQGRHETRTYNTVNRDQPQSRLYWKYPQLMTNCVPLAFSAVYG